MGDGKANERDSRRQLERSPQAPEAQDQQRQSEHIEGKQVVQQVEAEEVIHGNRSVEQHPTGSHNPARRNVEQMVQHQEDNYGRVDIDEENSEERNNSAAP